MVWTPGFESVVPGSNPSDSFYFFGQNSQTLRAYNSFSQKFAKMGPFPRYSTGLRELLDISLIHVLLRALYVTLVWKTGNFRYKIGRFLPFSYSFLPQKHLKANYVS